MLPSAALKLNVLGAEFAVGPLAFAPDGQFSLSLAPLLFQARHGLGVVLEHQHCAGHVADFVTP